MKPWRTFLPSSVRMGMFCKFGFCEAILPVTVPVWLKVVCTRPVLGFTWVGKAST